MLFVCRMYFDHIHLPLPCLVSSDSWCYHFSSQHCPSQFPCPSSISVLVVYSFVCLVLVSQWIVLGLLTWTWARGYLQEKLPVVHHRIKPLLSSSNCWMPVDPQIVLGRMSPSLLHQGMSPWHTQSCSGPLAVVSLWVPPSCQAQKSEFQSTPPLFLALEFFLAPLPWCSPSLGVVVVVMFRDDHSTDTHSQHPD